ncbi:hypothetical protein [Tsuneonella sp. HG222]
MPKRDKEKGGAKATKAGGNLVRKAIGGTKARIHKVPGPSTNPATNLLIADIGIRAASRLFRRSMEKGLLQLKFPAEKAHEIVEGRSFGQTLVTSAIARVATKSVPGALLVTGGLVAKAIFDRSIGRRESSRRGTRTLHEQAKNSD